MIKSRNENDNNQKEIIMGFLDFRVDWWAALLKSNPILQTPETVIDRVVSPSFQRFKFILSSTLQYLLDGYPKFLFSCQILIFFFSVMSWHFSFGKQAIKLCYPIIISLRNTLSLFSTIRLLWMGQRDTHFPTGFDYITRNGRNTRGKKE